MHPLVKKCRLVKQLSHTTLLTTRWQCDDDTTRYGPRTIKTIQSDDMQCFSVNMTSDKKKSYLLRGGWGGDWRMKKRQLGSALLQQKWRTCSHEVDQNRTRCRRVPKGGLHPPSKNDLFCRQDDINCFTFIYPSAQIRHWNRLINGTL